MNYYARSNFAGPKVLIADQIHAEKYRQEGETFSDAMTRVANALKDGPTHFHEFRDALLDQRFLPAGRVQSAMGAAKQVSAYNCFVGGTIPDSFTTPDNPEQSSIMARALEGAQTMRMGGGLGNDFTTLRPAGAHISKINSASTGPLKFMNIFNEVGAATSSTGERRGAQMGVLKIWHPDILAFINAKHDNTTLDRFNISVGVTDDFMEALARKSTYDLRFNGEVFGTVDAEELWEALMRSSFEWAEPGVLFIDRMNAFNNLWYAERIAATNPCGEQPLPPHGACLLGSFNLAKYIIPQGDGFYSFDFDLLGFDIPNVVRAMDNVVDRTIYPLPEQEVEAKTKRRMGLGVTGLANAGEALGFPYGSPGFIQFEHKVLRFITRGCYLASVDLAKEKGSFELFDAERYGQSKFVATLDTDVQDAIQRHGIRNSHLTSIAPTGTISMTADNVSSGCEPVFQYESVRPVILPGGKQMISVFDYGFSNFHVRGKRAGNGEVTSREHLDVLCAAQAHVDSSVSKTINLVGNETWDEFKAIYTDAYDRGAKGATTFNANGRRFGLFRMTKEADDVAFPGSPLDYAGGACYIDPATGQKECS